MKLKMPDQTIEIATATCEPLEDFSYSVQAIEALACSIVEVGQLHNAKVFEFDCGQRVIVAGNRRWLACIRAGLQLRADIWLFQKSDATNQDYAWAVRNAENVFRRQNYRRSCFDDGSALGTA